MRWTMKRVAKRIGIDKSTLYSKIKSGLFPHTSLPNEYYAYSCLRRIHLGQADIVLRRQKAIRIIVYTSKLCKGCKELKQWLKNNKYNNFEERDLDKDPTALSELQKIGISTLPTLVVGKEYITGFSPTVIKDFLERYY